MGTIAALIDGVRRRLHAAGVEEPLLEAQLLAAHGLAINRATLLARLSEPSCGGDATALESLVRRRETREPLAYITGHREFYGLDFVVRPGVLVPRPETEQLVEFALTRLQRTPKALVVDVGTGSSCIAVTLSVLAPEAAIIATDASADALAVARENLSRHNVSARVHVWQRDLLNGLGTFDLIVANLPYVPEPDWTELAPEVRDWEPREALVGGETGRDRIEQLLKRAPTHLRPGGLLLAEFGIGQGEALAGVARSVFPEADVSLRQDLAGHDRVLVVGDV
jgi:release factor glutamine methyltransferase